MCSVSTSRVLALAPPPNNSSTIRDDNRKQIDYISR